MAYDLSSFATDSGFYIGDQVAVPDGRVGCIDEIVQKGISYQLEEMVINVTIVRLDQKLWPDIQLTRVG